MTCSSACQQVFFFPALRYQENALLMAQRRILEAIKRPAYLPVTGGSIPSRSVPPAPGFLRAGTRVAGAGPSAEKTGDVLAQQTRSYFPSCEFTPESVPPYTMYNRIYVCREL